MQNIHRILIFLALVPSLSNTQTKYLSDGERGIGVNANYSSLNKTDNFAFNLGVSHNNRFGFGIHYGSASIINSLGGYVEWNIVRPTTRLPFGVVTGFAVTKSWFSETIYTGNTFMNLQAYNTIAFGVVSTQISLEGYALIKLGETFSLYPTAAFSRAWSSTSPKGYYRNEPINGYAFTIDGAIKLSEKTIMILLPGYLIVKDISSGAVGVSIIRFLD